MESTRRNLEDFFFEGTESGANIFLPKKKRCSGGYVAKEKGCYVWVMLQKGSLNDGLLVVFWFGLVC